MVHKTWYSLSLINTVVWWQENALLIKNMLIETNNQYNYYGFVPMNGRTVYFIVIIIYKIQILIQKQVWIS